MKTERVYDKSGAYWTATGRVNGALLICEAWTRRGAVKAFCKLADKVRKI